MKQPALVVPMGGGKYKVIAGHRRRLASIQLVKRGKEAYRRMPCMVDADEREPGEDTDELRAIDEAILLITTNGQREKTDWDKVQEATRLRELLDRKRQFGKIPGETRKLIAEQLGTTPAQVGRYDSIEKHLIKQFKSLLQLGVINISVAYELSISTEGEQQIALRKIQTTRHLSIEDVKQIREDMRTPKPPMEERDEPEAAEASPKCKPGVYVREMEKKSNIAPNAPPTEPPDVESAGKIVDFPAPPSPPPAEDTPPEKEPMHKRQAANILEDLQMYCEEMLAIEADLADTWAERADALAVAIAALRK